MPRIINAVFFIAPTARRSASSGSSDGFGDARGQQFVLQLSGRGDDRQAPLHGTFRQHAGDQQAVDLVGAFEDPVDARIPIVPFGGIVAHEAVAAVNLDVLVEDEVEHLAARHLEDGGLDGELLERGERRDRSAWLPCSMPSMRPAVRYSIDFDGVLADRHFGELVADGTERGERLAELPASLA